LQSWVWRQLRLELPDDWELLQFTRNPATGRCAFADRYQFRLELSWREVPGAPDLDRMISDYQARLDTDGLQETRRLQCAGWPGVSGVLPDGRTTCRYGAHFGDLQCLAELVFLWPKGRHEPLEKEVLASVRPEPATPAGQVHWQAFGLDLLTRSGGILEHCTADPAFAQFNFSSGRRRVWERFSRRGLVPQWLTEPVGQWQRRTAPRGFRVVFERDQDRHGHTVSWLRSERSALRFADLWLGRRQFEAAAWRCPRDGRVYQLSREAPRPNTAAVAGPPIALRCCADLEVTL